MDLTGIGLKTDANGNIAVDDSSSGLNGMLGAVLGKEVTTGTTSNQATHNTTSQNTTGSNAQTSTNQQTTAGTQATTGNQATTGTVGNVQSGNTTTNQTTKTNADVKALRDVYAKQSAGVTPDMLAAIFQQGAKAAPNLVVGTSNALGARGVGNTPMAQVLNQLNMDLVAKAADMNRQMLTDSGATAAQIAELTKQSTTAGTQANTGTQTQTQNLNTASTSNQVNNQVLNAIGSQNTNTTQAVTGVQDQATQASESKRQSSTINTGVAKSLAGMAAAGVGINELFKLATGKGFVGTITDFAKKLAGSGVTKLVTDGINLSGIFDTAGNMVASAPDLAAWGAGTIGSGGTDLVGSIGDYAGAVDTGGGFGDLIGGIFGWADGGTVTDADFLPVDKLIKGEKRPVLNPDADMEALLRGSVGANSTATAATRSPTQATGTPQRDTSNSGDGSVGGVGAASIGNIGTAAGGTGVSNSVAGMIGSIASAITGIPGLSTAAQGLNAAANSQAAAVNAEQADLGMNAAAAQANAIGFGPSGTMGDDGGLGIGGISVGDSGLGVSVGSGLGGGIGGGLGSDAGGIGGIGGESIGGIGGESAGGDGGSAGGDGGSSGGVSAGDGDGGSGGGGGGGGGCFLTTAITDATGGGDKDPMLETMRSFRDGVMRKDPKLSGLVDKYYEVAPAVVAAIDKRPDAKQVYSTLREHYLQPGVAAVNRGDTEEALRYYSEMMAHVGQYADNSAGKRMQAGAEQVLGGMADGGEVEGFNLDGDNDSPSGQAAGLSDDSSVDTLHPLLLPLLAAAINMPKAADGGRLIEGPGTGVSDSIPATGPSGQPMRVANGEYIIPADVVEKFGVQAFDNLVGQHHVPAAMQKAANGR